MPISPDQTAKLAQARHALSNLRARLDKAKSGSAPRVELHVSLPELELVVQLAEQAERTYRRAGY